VVPSGKYDGPDPASLVFNPWRRRVQTTQHQWQSARLRTVGPTRQGGPAPSRISALSLPLSVCCWFFGLSHSVFPSPCLCLCAPLSLSFGLPVLLIFLRLSRSPRVSIPPCLLARCCLVEKAAVLSHRPRVQSPARWVDSGVPRAPRRWHSA
jgi:hypothetical protein